ncbi:MAG: hypothetical protein IJX17_00455, partial [Clostridia bacterium]|nr:hypothetical protein [Clostridia bacterium]
KSEYGIAIKVNYLGRSYFSIAVAEKIKEYYKTKILDYIVFMIIDDYKFNYYKDNLLLLKQNIVSQSFLKAISIFDSEMDGEFIKEQIELSGEILVDSLFHFKLRPLQEKWQKTASVINQNQILCSTESMIEVLKYLTNSSENFLMTANVFIEKKQIKFKKYSSYKYFKKDFNGYSNFLTELVRLNPLKINLKTTNDDCLNDNIVELLSRIFADKIYLIN